MNPAKLLSDICGYLPAPHLQMQLKQYAKITGKLPALADEVWNFMNDNRKFMKKYSKDYRIVSLGADCLSRTYPTVYMLKPCRAAGEKGMPFDLTRTPPHGLAHVLENDFADYINDKWFYDHKNGRWNNDPATGIYYSHDRDCGPDQLAELQQRVQQRIGNFREVLKFPGLVFFILHKRLEGDIKDIDRACAALRKLRGDLPSKIIVIANYPEEEPAVLENAEYFLLKHPIDADNWFEPEVRFTEEGLRYEMQCVKLIRQLLQNELGVK